MALTLTITDKGDGTGDGHHRRFVRGQHRLHPSV